MILGDDGQMLMVTEEQDHEYLKPFFDGFFEICVLSDPLSTGYVGVLPPPPDDRERHIVGR